MSKRNYILKISLILFLVIFILNYKKTKDIKIKSTRNVFFDLGANIGDSAENFLGVLDKSSSTVDIRKVIPKDKYDEKWIIYLIEGNSKFDDNLLNIKNKYSSDKYEIIVYNSTVVTDYDGIINFYLDDNILYENKDVGSSILENHPFVSVKKIRETKKCVDFARLLNQYERNDFVVVKMDIEGAEFELLVHLIKENVLELIDILLIEYHKNLSPYNSEYSLFSKIFKKYNIKEQNWL